MTDLKNKLHITPESEKNLGNNFDKNEEIGDMFKNLPSNPEKIIQQAEEIRKQKAKEAEEQAKNIPSVVQKQEQEALAYFTENNEPEHIEVINHIQKLRAEGKIMYENLWWGKYNVIMQCGSKKLKMHFPPDTTLADTNYSWHNRSGDFKDKAISRSKLWSEEWQKYLKQKEKEWQKLLFEEEFKTLIQLLYPGWAKEEQILAFMIATGFYGRMWLSYKTWNYPRAVGCFRESANRRFVDMDRDGTLFSLVHSTFVE